MEGMAIAPLHVELTFKPKWWMRPALWAACIALRLGLVRDAASSEHWGCSITAEERVAKWLADHAFRWEVY